MSERETSDGVGMYLEIDWKNISADVIFVFGSIFIFVGVVAENWILMWSAS